MFSTRMLFDALRGTGLGVPGLEVEYVNPPRPGAPSVGLEQLIACHRREVITNVEEMQAIVSVGLWRLMDSLNLRPATCL